MNNKALTIVAIIILLVGSWAVWDLKVKPGMQNRGVKEVKSENGKLKITYVSALVNLYTLLDVAQEKGFLVKNNVEIERVPVKKNTEEILASGAADVDFGGLAGPLSLYLNGNETRWLASFYRPGGQAVSRYPKNEGNKIKKAAVTRFGGQPQLIVDLALEKIGVDPATVELVAMADDAGKAKLLEQGKVDFASLEAPNFVTENKLAEKYTVYDAAELYNKPVLDLGIFVMQKTLDSKEIKIQALINALYQSMQYMIENPTETIALIKEKNNFSQEKAESIYKGLIGSNKSTKFVPAVENIQPEVAEVSKEYKPSQPDRNLQAFAAAKYADSAASDKK